ncbi:hypothetical protein ACGFNX_07250 [Streptomyces sp. NPDC048723]|uniref:hypothetical protein n=1 Tax=unclassified Streptomyces TaxID=2593676 RepID=UPI0035632C85
MDLEQLRATCQARVEALRLPHRFSTRDLRDAVAEQRGRPVILRPLSTLGAKDAPCGIRSRKGDLPAETAWLLLVADASARHPAPENAGAAS